jgi:hypothetical protein
MALRKNNQKDYDKFSDPDTDVLGNKRPKAKSQPSDTIRGFSGYKVGDYVEEGDFESKFKKVKGDPSTFPQLSVQDYSTIKEDEKGQYVTKLKD